MHGVGRTVISRLSAFNTDLLPCSEIFMVDGPFSLATAASRILLKPAAYGRKDKPQIGLQRYKKLS